MVASLKKLTIGVQGMTCKSCELLLERKLKKVRGVRSVDADFRKGTVSVHMESGAAAENALSHAIREAGYRTGSPDTEAPGRLWLDIGGSIAVLFGIVMLLKYADPAALAPSTSGLLTVGGIFMIGLVAGSSSCLATTGGLLLAVSSAAEQSRRASWMPAMYFNIGRLVSYAFFGGIIGLIGRSLSLTPFATGIVTVAAAVLMIMIGLSQSGIAKGLALPAFPKRFTKGIAALADSEHPAAPALLGAGTFFLPCGFTQSLQLVALASGNFVHGSVIMVTFAFGTLPALAGISLLSAYAGPRGSHLLMRFSGVLMLALAVTNLQSGAALLGLVPSSGKAGIPAVLMGAREQSVQTVVTRSGYVPDSMTIRAGVPVRWTVDGTASSGCTSVMTIPALGISRPLARGENIIEFTATERGPLAFMCSMGMVRGTFHVI